MTKYTVLVKHITSPGWHDKVRPLEAQDLLADYYIARLEGKYELIFTE